MPYDVVCGWMCTICALHIYNFAQDDTPHAKEGIWVHYAASRANIAMRGAKVFTFWLRCGDRSARGIYTSIYSFNECAPARQIFKCNGNDRVSETNTAHIWLLCVCECHTVFRYVFRTHWACKYMHLNISANLGAFGGQTWNFWEGFKVWVRRQQLCATHRPLVLTKAFFWCWRWGDLVPNDVRHARNHKRIYEYSLEQWYSRARARRAVFAQIPKVQCLLVHL